MLRVAVEKEAAIDAYSKLWFESLQDDYLSPQDWEQLRIMLSLLQPFFRATKATEGDSATIDQVLFTMDILVQHYKKSLKMYKSDTFLHSCITRSWAVFDKYYLKTEDSPYYAAAIIFHPAMRTGYLRHN